MLTWISQNLATLLVGAAVAAVLLAVAVHLIRRHKSGQSSCACGCSQCAMSGLCHEKK